MSHKIDEENHEYKNTSWAKSCKSKTKDSSSSESDDPSFDWTSRANISKVFETSSLPEVLPYGNTRKYRPLIFLRWNVLKNLCNIMHFLSFVYGE